MTEREGGAKVANEEEGEGEGEGEEKVDEQDRRGFASCWACTALVVAAGGAEATLAHSRVSAQDVPGAAAGGRDEPGALGAFAPM